jgi:hypothetical protein
MQLNNLISMFSLLFSLHVLASVGPFSHQKGCYVRTITTRVQLEKKSLVMGLKGLEAKTN